MTAVLDATERPTTEVTEAATVPLASWGARAGAFSIDVLAGLGVIATLALLAWTAPLYGWLWWVYVATAVVVLVAMLVNRVWLASVRGWSLGRAVFGIRVTTPEGTAGPIRLSLRELAHLLDTAAVFIGWLWPLWDSRNRTFADLLTRTEVHRVDPPQANVRRRAGIALVVAALLGAAAAGLGYLEVYRADQTLQQARSQIANDGPRMVEQMLSYSVDSLDADFARAESLTTENYRSQLTAQQEVARKNPTNNDYWAVSSALLPGSTRSTATMLMAMQGQRGIDPNDLKFITATVRVDFRKVDGQWRVDNLTVLKKPVMDGAGQ